jgi:hypothetical protein
MGMTTLACADGSILAIDVWEHAYVAVARGHAGTGPSGDGRMMGRIRLGVSVPDGGTVLLGGQIRGVDYGCTSGACVVDTEVRANTRGGGTMHMRQRVTIDRATRMVTHIEVLNIVIEFTSAG